LLKTVAKKKRGQKAELSMKTNKNSHLHDCGRFGLFLDWGRVMLLRPGEGKSLSTIASMAVVALLALAAAPAQAGNILVNPCFNANSGRFIPEGWSRFQPPEPGNPHTNDYWIEGNEAAPICGTLYWKEWGAGYFSSPTNNVAGIYQEFSSTPGSVYQASGWFYTKSTDEIGNPTFGSYAWIDVSFLDASSNLLALYTSGDFSESVDPNSTNWFLFEVTNACDLSSPVATGDPYFTNYAVSGSVTQLVAPSGTAKVRYRFAYLQANTEGGSCYFDEAALDQSAGLYPPVIGNIFPQNMIYFPPTNGFNFTVSSPSGSTINSSAIHLTLNGEDVSSSLAISGASSNKAVLYSGLQSNSTYNASITVTDVFGLSSSASTYFETTWVGIPPILYLWEAEDFDFNSGMFIDNPDLCNAPGDTNCYYGTVGTPGVDEESNGLSPVSDLYRPEDQMSIDISGDYLRANLFLADRTDYEINPFDGGQWINYTRDFTNGTYWIIGRLATDINLSGYLTMSMVSDGATNELGTFTITNGLGWTSFENVFLLDTNGNKVNVTLNGKTTLQVTSGGNLLPNFFALVEATVDLPIMSGLYPDGAHPFEYTNTLSFNVTSDGATFPTNSIKVTLDGFDVSSSLIFSGSPSNQTVVYPDLLPNAIHTAIISVTNSLGHGFLLNDQFDTFSQSNYMVQASDFDFDGGQYVPDDEWYPNAYEGDEATTNIDFQHSTILGELYPYRPNGIPQQQGYDYLTTVFVDALGIDYDLGWFGPGDWANYTRTYSPGKYFVYVRSAGLGAYSMYLEQVVSGAGTTNQAVKKLGNWDAVGINDLTHAWVPLTDDGLAAPVVVSLSGLETLRITTTTGDCYPNYFMLVPTAGIDISASKQGANAVISFLTRSGVVYRIFSRDDLSSGSWSLLTTVLGTGAVEPVSIPVTGSAQFYKVVAP
jgi:hypothetical protein